MATGTRALSRTRRSNNNYETRFRQVSLDLYEKLGKCDSVENKEVSTFWMACFVGEFTEVKRQIDRAKKDESPDALTHLLERRETQLRLTPLMVCIHGVRSVRDTPPENFVKTARLLLESKANANAKDVIGSTALGQCLTGCETTPGVLQLALELGQHGADLNLANRFGETPLFTVVWSGDVNCITILMELGADPAKDASGGSAFQMVHGAVTSNAVRKLIAALVWKEGGCVGKKVVFMGIEGASSTLNRKIGTVKKLDPEKGKFTIEVADDGGAAPRTVLIPPKRLELANEFVEKKVKVIDLLVRIDLNGRIGECVRFLPTQGRYEVRLASTRAILLEDENNEELISLKPSNLQRLKSGSRQAMACFGCGKASGKDTNLKYCKGCYCVSYCGSVCSKKNWEKHKKECKARAAGQVRVDMEKLEDMTTEGLNGLVQSAMSFTTCEVCKSSTKQATDGKHSAWLFVVKVQIQPGATSEAHGAMVYDRTKETNFILPAAMSEEFDKVHAAVESKGIKG